MCDSNGAAVSSELLACPQCEKRFTRPENLARHMKTHNSIQKHRCQTCGRQFSRSDLRKKHELLHQRPTPARAVSRLRRRRGSRTVLTCDEPSLNYMPESVAEGSSALSEQDVGLILDGNTSPMPQEQPTVGTQVELSNTMTHTPWTEPSDHFDPYFDYATFARPWNYSLNHDADTFDWFSSQFFAALRETDLAYSPPFQPWGPMEVNLVDLNACEVVAQSHTAHPVDTTSTTELNPSLNARGSPGNSQVDFQPIDRLSGHTVTVPQVASPPNESSHEDRLPFAWNPRSKPIVRAKPIVLPVDDPIFAAINPRFAVSAETLSHICSFLRIHEIRGSEDDFTLPDRPLVNVFISLFFAKFLPQAPVLHRPTLDVQALPPALLAIMMVIGSCYSKLRHTRSFGIIVFDRIRRNLLTMIEDDNSLMREPMIIYTAALVCFMGLWCGNKRAFELSEALRSVVVTYIRRLPQIHDRQDRGLFQGHENHVYGYANMVQRLDSDPTDDLQKRWMWWVAKETHKRLRWFVYMIDSEFPSMLGMSGSMTVADIRKWECPCDEEFWVLPNAKSWKNRLGSASEPSCPVFGSLTALLLFETEQSTERDTQVLLPSANPWSANLLVTVAMSEIFHYQETLVVLRTYGDPVYETPTSVPLQKSDHGARLLTMLDLWYRSYGQPQQCSRRSNPASAHSQRISMITYYLARLYLVFPVSEIQDCLGKSGSADAIASMTRLSAWMTRCHEQAVRAVEDAATCITLIMCNEGESSPYDVIGLFLCHVVIWSIASVVSSQQKSLTIQSIRNAHGISAAMREVIEAGFAHVDTAPESGLRSHQLIFRHAIQSLVQLGTWGASSNLALLLHLHPSMTG